MFGEGSKAYRAQYEAILKLLLRTQRNFGYFSQKIGRRGRGQGIRKQIPKKFFVALSEGTTVVLTVKIWVKSN